MSVQEMLFYWIKSLKHSSKNSHFSSSIRWLLFFFSSSKIKLFLYMYALYTLSERYREKIHSMKLNKYNRIKLVNGLVRDETSGLNLAPSYLKYNNYGLGVLFSNIRRRSISWLATYSTVSLRQSQPFHFIRVIKRIEK